jgi:hypothetical protein
LSSSKTPTTSFAINCAKEKTKNATNYNHGAHGLQPTYKPNYYLTTSFTLKLCKKQKCNQLQPWGTRIATNISSKLLHDYIRLPIAEKLKVKKVSTDV